MNKLIYKSASDDLSITTVENIFINEFMPEANGDYIKVYLYGLKNSQNPQSVPLPDDKLAEHLHIKTSTILEAWEYWHEKGVVKIERIGKDLRILFNKLQDVVAHNATIRTNPDLFPNKYRNDSDFQQLIRTSEKLFQGKVLSPVYIDTFIEWIENYNFSYDLIIYLIQHCLEMMNEKEFTFGGKLNYFKKVADDWYSKDIDNIQDAIFYVGSYKASKGLIYKILRGLGLRRAPLENDYEYVDKWTKVYNFSEEIILEAVKRTSIPRLNYLDGILTNWFNKGYTTIEQVQSEPKRVNRSNNNAKSNKQLSVKQDRIEAVKSFEDNIFESFRKKLNTTNG